ncbi:MAG: ABC transporter substrate-binding protein [Erysipelotrichales bacterium]|nr:ABC transporter substrate-binding protein [Erysipelotrichales bacterium]
MKRSIIIVLSVAFLSIYLSGCGLARTFQCRGRERLEVFNWGEYMDRELIRSFEEEYNVCVNITTFSSNEIMLTRLQTQSFDLIFPSDYALEQLASEGGVQAINWDLIDFNPNTGFADDLMYMLEYLKEDGFNLLRYGAPYFWGSVGIIYNKETVNRNELYEHGWNIFHQRVDGRRILFYDSSRDAFMVALKALGYSSNSTNDREIEAAAEWLREMRRIHGRDVSFLTDEVLEDMPALRHDLALAYSGDAVFTMTQNDSLGFFKPDATNIWVDAMAIPTDARNVELAHKFISFLLQHDNALQNTSAIGFSAAVASVYDYVLAPGGIFHAFADAYRVRTSDKDEMFRYLGSAHGNRLANEWLRITI